MTIKQFQLVGIQLVLIGLSLLSVAYYLAVLA